MKTKKTVALPLKLRSSRTLASLRRRGLPTVFKLNLSEPRVVEIAGLSGVDAVWLCTEHVPNEWLSLENQIRAARVHGIDAFVRVSRGSYSDYLRPFEAGAAGIIVPHVATVEEARQVIEWVRFNPIGKRALDGGNVDGCFCQVPVDRYIRHCNREQLVILQIESPEALEEVEKIAALEGFNGLLFGPGDFSHRIGQAGNLLCAEVTAARKRIAAAAQRHGKFAMTPGLFAPVDELLAEGYRVFSLGADVIGMGEYFRARLDSFGVKTNGSRRSPSTYR